MKSIFIILILLTSTLCNAQTNEYSIVFLKKKTDAAAISKEESKKIMDGHMANMKKLADEGKLLVAGPFDGGGGIFVMNSTSKVEVEEWISADPGVQAKRWNIEILPYKPRYGSICPVGENYEMTSYSFVRFDAIRSKFTANNYAEIMEEHAAYLRQIITTGNVVTEAIFGEHDGGILIVKGALDPAVINADPAVTQGLIEIQIKNLFIAKGSFCEK